MKKLLLTVAILTTAGCGTTGFHCHIDDDYTKNQQVCEANNDEAK